MPDHDPLSARHVDGHEGKDTQGNLGVGFVPNYDPLSVRRIDGHEGKDTQGNLDEGFVPRYDPAVDAHRVRPHEGLITRTTEQTPLRPRRSSKTTSSRLSASEAGMMPMDDGRRVERRPSLTYFSRLSANEAGMMPMDDGKRVMKRRSSVEGALGANLMPKEAQSIKHKMRPRIDYNQSKVCIYTRTRTCAHAYAYPCHPHTQTHLRTHMRGRTRKKVHADAPCASSSPRMHTRTHARTGHQIWRRI